MEKRQLVDLLHHYASSSTQEAESVISLRDEYPFSQVLQVLSAKVSKDHNLGNQQALLQSAAVYSTDRTVLKEIITAVFTQPSLVAEVKTPEAPVEVKKVQYSEPIAKPLSTTQQKTIDSIDYADEVILDLKKLNELKLNYESVVAGIQGSTPEETEAPAPVKRSPGRPKKKAEPVPDNLLESIESTKKKIEPENTTTKEQIAIIDQFIKAQPSITPKIKSNSTADQPPQTDLSEVKSGEYSDTIVSETLAEILVRQGKKDKAIEVYRKLIWKFPQKKAYFAAQIEDLKK